MRIRIRTRAAGPGVNLGPGSELDLADHVAQQWIAAGYAEAVGAEVAPVQVATVIAPEYAISKRARGRPKTKGG